MTAVEPGERARDLLREADEAYRDGAWLKVSAAADLAVAYLHAAQLDRDERAEREATEWKRRDDEQQRQLEESFRGAGLLPYGPPPMESPDAPA